MKGISPTGGQLDIKCGAGSGKPGKHPQAGQYPPGGGYLLPLETLTQGYPRLYSALPERQYLGAAGSAGTWDALKNTGRI
ncbi:hypothetical protein M8494_03025 [Serratia ureilytica]